MFREFYGVVAWNRPKTGDSHLGWEVIHPVDGPETQNTPAGAHLETTLPRDQLAGLQPCLGRAGIGDALAER